MRTRRHAWSTLLSFLLIAGLLILPAASASATSFVVVNMADSGQGSLRQAILDANANPGADDITFAIPGFRPLIISPSTPLPAITEQVSIDASTESGSSCVGWPPTLRVSIEGSSAPAGTNGFTVSGGVGTTIKGFIIRQFGGDGVSLSAPASGTTVECNAIGTTPDLSIQEGMLGAGIAVRSTDPNSSAPTSIVGNLIMNNGGPGVLVDQSARSVSIRNNRIDSNLGVGIDLVANGGAAGGDGSTPNGGAGPGAGGNDLQSMPQLSAASSASGVTRVMGSLSVPSAVAGQFVVEFFTQDACDTRPAPGGFGEGARPIGSVSLAGASTPGPSTIAFTANGLDNTNVGGSVTATATDGFGSGNTSEFSSCIPVVAGNDTSADLSAGGSVSPVDVAGGGTLTYTLTAHNIGPDPATDAKLVSQLPPGINLSSAISGSGSCAAVGFTVTCDVGTVDPGADAQVTIVAVAQDVAGVVSLDNQVSVSTSTIDPVSSNDAVTITSSLHARQPNLSIQKDGPAQVAPGDAFSYTIHVANAGPDKAMGVIVTDPLPAGVSFVGATPSVGSCAEASGTVTCPLGTLANGANASIGIQVRADALPGTDPIVVSNTASVTSDRPDQNPNDNVSAPVLTKVAPANGADLALSSVVNVPNPVTGGYDLGSTATVTNLGPGDATHVSLTDTLASGESFVAAGSNPSCTAAANVVTCALGPLAHGAVATVLIITKTPEVTTNTTLHDVFAVVTAPEDSTPANDTLDVATAVLARRADFAAGYVPPSSATTWITDVTQWSHGIPVATMSDPTVAWVAVPGGGPGGPVTITERACGLPFVCVAPRPMSGFPYPYPRGVFGNLVSITVPPGYGASNPIAGIFLDDWSVVGWGWDPFKVSYLNAAASAPAALSWCEGWRHSGPPCVSWLARIYSWWNPFANGDLHSVVRFTNSGTFGRGR